MPSEKYSRDKARAHCEKQGWYAMSTGFADFMCHRRRGKCRLKFVEVKGPKDQLHGNQHEVLQLLVRAGFEASIIFVERLNPKTGKPEDFEYSYNTGRMTSLETGAVYEPIDIIFSLRKHYDPIPYAKWVAEKTRREALLNAQQIARHWPDCETVPPVLAAKGWTRADVLAYCESIGLKPTKEVAA